MNKNQFLQTLKQALPQLSPNELSDIMSDFEEHFNSGLADGKSEAEICAELGSPTEIAQQYKDGWSAGNAAAAPKTPTQPQYLYPQPASGSTPPPSPPSPPPPPPQAKPAASGQINGGALIAVIVLNVLFGIPIWISLFSTLCGFWAAAGGIGVAAVALFVVAIVQAGIEGLALAFFGLALTALTVLAVILVVYLTKWLCIGLVKYIGWNRRLVMGGSPA